MDTFGSQITKEEGEERDVSENIPKEKIVYEQTEESKGAEPAASRKVCLFENDQTRVTDP